MWLNDYILWRSLGYLKTGRVLGSLDMFGCFSLGLFLFAMVVFILVARHIVY